MPPLTIEQVFQLALGHHEAGRLAEAERIYRHILAVQPDHADALHLLGAMAHQLGKHDAAVELITKAIAILPNFAGSHFNLGNALKAMGRVDEAISAYRRSIILGPKVAEPHNNLGNALKENGSLNHAIKSYRQAIALRHDFPEAHLNLGTALQAKGQLDEAIAAYRQSIALKPNSDAYGNLGIALQAKGLQDDAIAAFRQAIAIQPGNAMAYGNLGSGLKDKGQFDEAIAVYRQAIALNANYPDAYSNLGLALQAKGHFGEAITSFRQAITLRNDFRDAHYNLGTALRDTGQLDEALVALHRAIAIDPDYAEAHFGISYLQLLRGNFAEGWEKHEWRWKLRETAPTPRNFNKPQWNGGDIEGRTILLHADQGLGDTLQFVRYAPLVVARGACVIIECQPELKTLLTGMEGVSQVIGRGEPLPAFGLHCPIMSLPLAFGTHPENIPATIPYLRSDVQKTDAWRKRLEHKAALKVGLVWAGAPRPENRAANRTDRRRSISLSQLAPLGGVSGVIFVSLQKGSPAAQAKSPPGGMTLEDWTDELHDFADTAALVSALDLVISVDTSVAHLAGALGKPVWLLNRFDTCWRWMMEREDTPWYPTMRIFRQPEAGDWDSVIVRVVEALAEFRP
jgi:tetratricopeptide (TPR) repeat protein